MLSIFGRSQARGENGADTEWIVIKSYSYFFFSNTDMERISDISDGYGYESRSVRIFIKMI